MKGGGLINISVPSGRLLHSYSFRSRYHRAMSTLAGPDSSSTPPDVAKARASSLCMQVILRRDLLDVESWPVGPLIAQGSHAATALMHLYKDHQAMKDYTEDWKHMRKVSRLVIQVDNGRVCG